MNPPPDIPPVFVIYAIKCCEEARNFLYKINGHSVSVDYSDLIHSSELISDLEHEIQHFKTHAEYDPKYDQVFTDLQDYVSRLKKVR